MDEQTAPTPTATVAIGRRDVESPHLSLQIGCAANDAYLVAAINAARTRTYRAAVSAGLTHADREDLYQEIILDLFERAPQFVPAKGSAGTFTGMVSQHRVADFLGARAKDRARLSFCCGPESANDDEFPSAANDILDAVAPVWAEDRDLFDDTMALRDLQTAVTYMDHDQQSLLHILQAHGDLPSAQEASGLSSATFYRRVQALRMHLRMFGIRSAA